MNLRFIECDILRKAVLRSDAYGQLTQKALIAAWVVLMGSLLKALIAAWVVLVGSLFCAVMLCGSRFSTKKCYELLLHRGAPAQRPAKENF